MTITNEIVLDGTPLAAPGVWYTADIAESSFVENVKVRINEVGPAEARFYLKHGGEYTYKITDEFAGYVWADLNQGISPGAIFSNVKAESRYTPSDYKPAPQVSKSITVSGDADKITLLAAHASFLGLSVIQ